MRRLTKITAFSLSLLSLIGIPAMGLEWTTTVLYFNVAANDEITVTLLGESAAVTADGGTSTPQNIEFNSTTGTDEWLNSTVTGTGGSVQDDTNAILQIDNTGNSNAEMNLTLDEGTSALNACQKLRYHTTYQADVATDGILLNSTTNVTLDSSYTPAEAAIDLWLWANFTGCGATDDTYPTLQIVARFL